VTRKLWPNSLQFSNVMLKKPCFSEMVHPSCVGPSFTGVLLRPCPYYYYSLKPSGSKLKIVGECLFYADKLRFSPEIEISGQIWPYSPLDSFLALHNYLCSVLSKFCHPFLAFRVDKSRPGLQILWNNVLFDCGSIWRIFFYIYTSQILGSTTDMTF